MRIERRNIHRLLYIVSAILLFFFVVCLIVDIVDYNPSYSAPFYVIFIVRIIEFVVPSIMTFLIGKFLKEKNLKILYPYKISDGADTLDSSCGKYNCYFVIILSYIIFALIVAIVVLINLNDTKYDKLKNNLYNIEKEYKKLKDKDDNGDLYCVVSNSDIDKIEITYRFEHDKAFDQKLVITMPLGAVENLAIYQQEFLKLNNYYGCSAKLEYDSTKIVTTQYCNFNEMTDEDFMNVFMVTKDKMLLTRNEMINNHFTMNCK